MKLKKELRSQPYANWLAISTSSSHVRVCIIQGCFSFYTFSNSDLYYLVDVFIKIQIPIYKCLLMPPPVFISNLNQNHILQIPKQPLVECLQLDKCQLKLQSKKHLGFLLDHSFPPLTISSAISSTFKVVTKKEAQLQSCQLSFIWGKMRTAALETAPQRALRLLKRGSQKRSIYKTLVKGEFNAIKRLLYKKFSASHVQLMSP